MHRMIRIRRGFVETCQELSLIAAQLLRNLDDDPGELIAAAMVAQAGKTLVFQPENLVPLRSGRDLELHLAFQRGHLDLVAERGLAEGERNLADHVELVSREELMRQDVEHDVEIAG